MGDNKGIRLLRMKVITYSADSCVRKRGVRVTGLSKLIFCVVWVIWGLADMVRAGVSSADLSTPFWGVKRGFRG